MLAGAGGELAFQEVVPDGMAGCGFMEQLLQPVERGDLGDAATEDLIFREADGLGLAVVNAQISELNGIEESKADGRGLVDGLEFRALSIRLFLLGAELVGSGLAVVDVGCHAEPVEDVSGVVADGQGAEPPPAYGAVTGADHAGFDVVLIASVDGLSPGFEDAFPLFFGEGVEPECGLRGRRG